MVLQMIMKRYRPHIQRLKTKGLEFLTFEVIRTAELLRVIVWINLLALTSAETQSVQTCLVNIRRFMIFFCEKDNGHIAIISLSIYHTTAVSAAAARSSGAGTLATQMSSE